MVNHINPLLDSTMLSSAIQTIFPVHMYCTNSTHSQNGTFFSHLNPISCGAKEDYTFQKITQEYSKLIDTSHILYVI